MGVEKDDGLGLSLGLGMNHHASSSSKENLMHKPCRNLPNRRNPWSDIFLFPGKISLLFF